MRTDPRMTTSDRTRFVLTLVVLGMLAVVATCGSCAGAFWQGSGAARTATEQYNAAVKITVLCMAVDEDGLPSIDVDTGIPKISTHYGSGTLLSAHEVLTAAHVQHCPEGSIEAMGVDAGDGEQHVATTDVLLPASDVTRLHVDDDMGKWFTPIMIGPLPTIGDRVCAAAAVPREMYRCWTAQNIGDDPDGNIGLDGFTEFGESGSALFNDHGQLIGVVVMLQHCQQNLQCHGMASSVAKFSWLIP